MSTFKVRDQVVWVAFPNEVVTITYITPPYCHVVTKDGRAFAAAETELTVTTQSPKLEDMPIGVPYAEHNCNCNIVLLMQGGCVCGGK